MICLYNVKVAVGTYGQDHSIVQWNRQIKEIWNTKNVCFIEKHSYFIWVTKIAFMRWRFIRCKTAFFPLTKQIVKQIVFSVSSWMQLFLDWNEIETENVVKIKGKETSFPRLFVILMYENLETKWAWIKSLLQSKKV